MPVLYRFPNSCSPRTCLRQREAKEKIKEFAKTIEQSNKAKLSAARPARPKPKAPTARDKALNFAKNVPKPEARKKREEGEGEDSAGGLASSGEGGVGDKAVSALEQLEARHAADARQVDAIRAEMAKMLS